MVGGNFICIRDCNTKDLKIDPKIHCTKTYYFKKYSVCTIYGIVEGTKAVYDETRGEYEYDNKFMGWVTKEFVIENFVEEKSFNRDLIEVNDMFLNYVEAV